MEETKAYKLNKEKQPAGEKGKFLYYFYNNETLDSVAVVTIVLFSDLMY